ncbi:MAG: hypothetical protein IJW44_04155, partial [Clostridia bacterium]|nr:hypothetical protein [Clostridia bacterium]
EHSGLILPVFSFAYFSFFANEKEIPCQCFLLPTLSFLQTKKRCLASVFFCLLYLSCKRKRDALPVFSFAYFSFLKEK